MSEATSWIREASALLVVAGAGMGVDSGLPDFRGPTGFWRAFPPLEGLDLVFEDVANPRLFRDDYELAWGFYGYRLNSYTAAVPHEGYGVLRRLADTKPTAVFTTNVDGFFHRAGFPIVVEAHGSLNWYQCANCRILLPLHGPFSVDERLRCVDPPSCPRCRGRIRPNVLMFGDSEFDPTRTAAQEEVLDRWLESHGGGGLVVVEVGAGTVVSSARDFSQTQVDRGARLVRINLREAEVVGARCVGMLMGARDALISIEGGVS